MRNISEWLDQQGLTKYTGAFSDNDIDFRVLPELTDSDLKELGVSLGHRKLLLKAIGELNKDQIPDSTPSTLTTTPLSLGHAEAERRQLTVMFCDLVGSTELSSRLDPEDLREIIHLYQDTCAKVINRYGGYIAQYLGDGIVIYFGYPLALEDAAERAVRTGLEIISAVAELPKKSGARIQVRLGAATGIAVVGDLIGMGASEQHAVIGQVPNLAARIQSLAEPGGLVIAESTRHLIRKLYETRDLGAHQLKGINGEVHAFQVLHEHHDVLRFEATRLRRSTCVGRERELEFLLKKWRQSVAGTGQVVLAWGEAGIGKSRLLRLLGDKLEGESFSRIHLQCSPQHGDSPLYPAIQAILKALEFSPTDCADDKLSKIDAFLSASGQIERAPLLASLLSIPFGERYPSLTLPPEEQKIAFLNQCIDYAIILSNKQPLLYQIEDAHWIDPSTEEFLIHLVGRVKDHRIFVLVTGRPEYQPEWLNSPHANELDLGRLGEAEIRAIVRGIAGKTLPEEVMVQILSKTDGVPLFVEELTRTVLESGLLRDSGESWVLDGPLPAMAIPASLQDSLMARLDRLSSAKEVVQAAATIGRRFSYAMLAAILDVPSSALRSALGRLVEAELINPQSETGGREYQFRHALVQDTAYESLLKSRRQTLHARIVRAYETHFAELVENEPEILAYHATRAGLTEQAVNYGLKAGRRSLYKSANKEALGQLRNALELIKTLPEEDERNSKELDLQLAYGNASMAVHGYVAHETVSAFKRAQDLAKQIGQLEQYKSLMSGLYAMHLINCNFEMAETIAEQVIEYAQKKNNLPLESYGHRMIGVLAFENGNLSDASKYLRLACNDDPKLSYGYIAYTELLKGNADTASKFYADYHEYLREENPLAVGQALHFKNILLALRKDFQSQLSESKFSFDYCNENNIHFYATYSRVMLLNAEMRISCSEDSFQEYMEAVRDADHISVLNQVFFHAEAADFLRELGQPENAIKKIEKVFALISSSGVKWYEPEVERIHGECFMALSPPRVEEAEACFSRALKY
jgi:class 3 adenylate cyclase